MATPKITALTYNNGKPFVSGIEVAVGGVYTITAQVNTATRSVKWLRDGNPQTDNAAPFQFVWNPGTLGPHTFVVRPYARSNAGGNSGPAITVNCTVIKAVPPPPLTTTALVSWTQVANGTGYRVMWGTVSQQYSYVQDVGNNLEYRVPDLKRGTTYYFSAKTYNATQLSDFAKEVAYVPA